MKKTGIIVGLIVLLGLGGIAGGYYYFVQRPNITVGDDGIIFIQPGDSFETVMTTLILSPSQLAAETVQVCVIFGGNLMYLHNYIVFPHQNRAKILDFCIVRYLTIVFF